MRISINYDNGLSSLADAVSQSVADVIEAAGNAVADSARSVCPVRTGALRNSIEVTREGSCARVSANTDYAAYVEFGTSKMAPEPYLVPSLIENADAIESAIANAIGGLI